MEGVPTELGLAGWNCQLEESNGHPAAHRRDASPGFIPMGQAPSVARETPVKVPFPKHQFPACFSGRLGHNQNTGTSTTES